MLRGFPVIAVAAAGMLTAPGQPVAEPAPAYVKVAACSPAHGSAAFYGRMSALVQGEGERMSMRFSLLERTGDGPYQQVRAPRLARWRRSRPGVAAFGYRQKVKGLSEDGVYRARVEFRWRDADGHLLRRAQRRSRPCRQAGPLPNLRARIVDSRPTANKGVFHYTVRAANVGGAPADQVAVALEVDGSAVDTQTLPRLEPGEARALEFSGPRCQGSVRAVADPSNSIRESSETDNSQSLPCAHIPRR
jgi:hypothetical protein